MSNKKELKVYCKRINEVGYVYLMKIAMFKLSNKCDRILFLNDNFRPFAGKVHASSFVSYVVI